MLSESNEQIATRDIAPEFSRLIYFINLLSFCLFFRPFLFIFSVLFFSYVFVPWYSEESVYNFPSKSSNAIDFSARMANMFLDLLVSLVASMSMSALCWAPQGYSA